MSIAACFAMQTRSSPRVLAAGAGLNRRSAAALLASALLGACGGGGAGGADTGSPGVSTSPASAASGNIAVWGDSLTPGFAENLGAAFPGRAVYDGGVGGETSSQIAARVFADRSRSAWINIFWMGANNVDQPAQIKADIAASIATLAAGNNRFVVLPVVNDAIPTEYRGTPLYATIMQVNAELALMYPQHYVDVRAYLVSQFDPSNAQDALDVQNDLVPSSMRIDDIHLNYKGQEVAVQKVHDYISAKGW
jgi:lysophospholipase L1-like esterase